MKILITDLRDEEGLVLKGQADPLPYQLDCGQGETWESIDYDLHATRLGQECLVSGSLVGRMKIPCARCLEKIPFQIQVPAFQHTVEIVNEESIDLTSLIREDILLDFPIAVSCPLEAGNKCSYSGIVYKEDDHGFADKRRDDIWGALEKLNKKEENGNAKKKNV
jgi:uncharacterized metal-binding protein YceD (DUF177 family)